MPLPQTQQRTGISFDPPTQSHRSTDQPNRNPTMEMEPKHPSTNWNRLGSSAHKSMRMEQKTQTLEKSHLVSQRRHQNTSKSMGSRCYRRWGRRYEPLVVADLRKRIPHRKIATSSLADESEGERVEMRQAGRVHRELSLIPHSLDPLICNRGTNNSQKRTRTDDLHRVNLVRLSPIRRPCTSIDRKAYSQSVDTE